METKTINLDTVKPSRIYSWVYEGPMKLNKGGRAGVPENPFYGDVTVRKVFSGQAASHDMYVHAWEKRNPGKTYTPDPSRTARFHETANPCVVQSTDGELQARILNPQAMKTEVFIRGKLATPGEVSALAPWMPPERERTANDVPVMFPYVHNLLNVELP